MSLNFYSLSSGSSGNCYFIGNGFHGMLIDAGISARSICKFLKDIQVSIQSVMGICITHNHGDHIRGLEVLIKKYRIPVYTTETIWKSILDHPLRLNIPADCVRKISPEEPFLLAGNSVTAFPVHHDAPQTVGYHIIKGEHRITVATDLGHVCPTAGKYIKAANLLVIESNYDEQMLLNGSYPYFLKSRIRSNNGHLGNQQMADFLSENFHSGLQHICLAHLSKNNNTPETALNTLKETFSSRGIVLNGKPGIIVLNRNLPTGVISL